jgi:hypothetical protein
MNFVAPNKTQLGIASVEDAFADASADSILGLIATDAQRKGEIPFDDGTFRAKPSGAGVALSNNIRSMARALMAAGFALDSDFEEVTAQYVLSLIKKKGA